MGSCEMARERLEERRGKMEDSGEKRKEEKEGG